MSDLTVAVVGSGMGGLSAAWLLTHQKGERVNVQVDIYEAYEHLGLGAHSVDVEVKQGSSEGRESRDSRDSTGSDTASTESFVIDIPPRVFVNEYYTQLLSLYNAIGVDFYTSNAATSYQILSTETGRMQETFFSFFNLILGKSLSIPMITLGRHLLSFSFLRILWDLFRFKREAKALFVKGETKGVTLGHFLDANGYSKDFADKFFIPMFAVICTCSCQSVRNYPLHAIVEFMLCLTLQGSGVKRAVQNTREIVAKLSEGSTVYLSSSVTGIWTKNASASNAAELHDELEKSGNSNKTSNKVIVEVNGKQKEYDHVIVATQANHAMQILRNPSEQQSFALKSIIYEATRVVLHRDKRLMPANVSSWSPMNIFVAENGSEAMCTAWQNKIQPVLGTADNVFQTWNPLVEPEKELTLTSHVFQRPIVGLGTDAALETLANIQGCGNIWYCGAYSLPGIPLLENAARSGLAVAESISGAKRPWKPAIERNIGKTTSVLSRIQYALSAAIVVTGLGLAASKLQLVKYFK